MRYRTFPHTELTVSEVGFGVWTLSTGWWGHRTDDEAVALLREASDLGVTLFDTADTYGNGRGETLLQKAFGNERHRIVIATKGGYDFYQYGDNRRGQREIPHDFSPSFLRFAVEQSLSRLGTDHIDLYQLHNPRLEHLRDDLIFETLDALQAEGKIRYYGVALGPAIGWEREGVAAMEERQVTILQIIYNLLEQDPTRTFIPIARETGTGFLVRVPHSSGLLEGRYTENTVFPEGDHRRHRPRSWLINGLKKVEQIRFLTDDTGRTPGQAAIKFILAEPAMISTLPNIYDSEQLREFAAAPDTPDLTVEELERIAELYAVNFWIDEPPMELKGTSLVTPREATAVVS